MHKPYVPNVFKPLPTWDAPTFISKEKFQKNLQNDLKRWKKLRRIPKKYHPEKDKRILQELLQALFREADYVKEEQIKLF